MNASSFVTLLNGQVLPMAPLQLLWRLEDQGFCFRVDDGDIVVSPRDRLTDEDRVELRRWKRHVVEILVYANRLPFVQ